MRVAELLSDFYHATPQKVRNFRFSSLASGKLARYLLGSVAGQNRDNGHPFAHQTLTMNRVAKSSACLGKVTHLLSSFKQKNIIRANGSFVLINRQAALEGQFRPECFGASHISDSKYG